MLRNYVSRVFGTRSSACKSEQPPSGHRQQSACAVNNGVDKRFRSIKTKHSPQIVGAEYTLDVQVCVELEPATDSDGIDNADSIWGIEFWHERLRRISDAYHKYSHVARVGRTVISGRLNELESASDGGCKWYSDTNTGHNGRVAEGSGYEEDDHTHLLTQCS